ncbi:MAG: hypothetical protein CM1200mP18_11340 [Gammaproteobacteria bacterium]|nr:MAG: hypothetical protein CM1200mP18_11340 [Gammaproteobacteria bacterium]
MHEKDFYNDLSGVLERSWLLLEQSIEDPTSPIRTPVLISVSADGLAQGRTVVLRAFNRQQTPVKNLYRCSLRKSSTTTNPASLHVSGLPAQSDDSTAPQNQRCRQPQQ